VTKDGLHLYKQTKERVAYVRPGATFTQFKRLALLDCYVEFSKDWVSRTPTAINGTRPARSGRATSTERRKRCRVISRRSPRRSFRRVGDTRSPTLAARTCLSCGRH